MANARVSIIIPTYNRAAFLPKAVASAQQAGGDLEVIVVDDASTDETHEICRALRNVRLVRLEKNVGLAAARNAGIAQSGSEFIALLDDDDLRLPDSLPMQLESLASNPQAALCYGRVLIGDTQTGEPTGESIPLELHTGDLFWKLLRANFIPGLSVVARRESLIEVGLFDRRLRQIEDWDLWLRMSERRPFTAVEQPVAIYRMFARGSAQLSSNRARMALAAAAVQRRASGLPRAASDQNRVRVCRRNFLREMRHTLLLETAEALIVGQKKSARSYLQAVVRLHPRTLTEWREIRELAALALSCTSPSERAFVRRAKAVRKQLWERIPRDDH